MSKAKVREEFLAALEDSNEDFVAFFHKHRDRADSFNFKEQLQTLQKQQHATLWSGALARVNAVVHAGQYQFPGSKEADVAFDVLEGVVALAMDFISDKKRAAPQALFDTAGVLHDIMLSLDGEQGLTLQNHISLMCEKWWVTEREGKERLVPQMISYLLIRCLEDGASAKDLKRLLSVRTCLELLDLDDESSDTIKHLMLRCAIHPLFLRSLDGTRFLAFVFSLDASFIPHLHVAVKNQIPSCRPSLLAAFGDLYFRAWKLAQGQQKIKLEYDCIQDLMYAAIHAGQQNTAKAARGVLAAFHENKKQAGVDEMLCRLYAPILWRALKVANPSVRRNAVCLLSDAFPLQNPEGNRADNDELMQKQFDFMLTLLSDKYVEVRVVAIQCACATLGIYWELIPLPTIKSIVTLLATTSAFDASSAAVRAAVFEGFAFVLDNQLSHPLFKAILPQLSPLLHDRTERVRISFAKLLLVIKKLKSIRFYDVVDVDFLLHRLAVEKGRMVPLLTQLLMKSYFPHQKDTETQIKRSKTMLEQNPAAAYVFYSTAVQFSPVSTVCSFLGAAYKALVNSLKLKQMMAAQGSAASDNGSSSSNNSKKKKKKKTKTEPDDATAAGAAIDVDSVEAVEGWLWIMSGMWTSLREVANADSEEDMDEIRALEDVFSDGSLQQILDTFTTKRARLAVLNIATKLPAKSVPELSRSFEPQLKKLAADADAEVFGPMIDCMFAWGRHKEVIKLFSSAIELELQNKGSKAKSKGIHPHVALRCFEYIMEHEHTRRSVINDSSRVRKTMDMFVTELPLQFRHPEVDVQFMLDGVQLACKMQLHVFCKDHMVHIKMKEQQTDKENGGQEIHTLPDADVPSTLNDVMDFVTAVALPTLLKQLESQDSKDSVDQEPDKKRRNRKASKEEKTGAQDAEQMLAPALVQFAMDFAAEMITLECFNRFCPMNSVMEWIRLVNQSGVPMTRAFFADWIAALHRFAYQAISRVQVAGAPQPTTTVSTLELNTARDLFIAVMSVTPDAASSSVSQMLSHMLRVHKGTSDLPLVLRSVISPVIGANADPDSKYDDENDQETAKEVAEEDVAVEQLDDLSPLQLAVLTAVAKSPGAIFALPKVFSQVMSSQPNIQGWPVCSPTNMLRSLSALALLADTVVTVPAKRAKFLESLSLCAQIMDQGNNGDEENTDHKLNQQEQQNLAKTPQGGVSSVAKKWVSSWETQAKQLRRVTEADPQEATAEA